MSIGNIGNLTPVSEDLNVMSSLCKRGRNGMMKLKAEIDDYAAQGQPLTTAQINARVATLQFEDIVTAYNTTISNFQDTDVIVRPDPTTP